MEKRKKRSRGSNWNHAHTMALAELKREASLNKEDGRLVWERIAQTLSGRFPDQIRTADQCRMRWDTLVKVYNHVEDYCVVTGAQDHRELDEGELASMELATAYHRDWYDIVEQVCSQRRRKERGNRDLMLAKRIKGSSPGSHSVELPERLPNRDTLCSSSTSKSVTYHEQSTPESTSTYAQVSSCPSLEADKLGPEEQLPRLRNENDGLVREETQHGQVSHETLESANLRPHTFPAENGAQLEEDEWMALQLYFDQCPLSLHCAFETSAEVEQPQTESELTDLSLRSWESDGLGARPEESLQDYVLDDSFDDFIYDDCNVLFTRNLSVASSSSSGVMLFSDPALLSSAIVTSSTSSRSADSTISRQSRRWSLKGCHAWGRKETAEDLEMESKQAARLEEKTRVSRKENAPAILNAASSTSATSATTRGDRPLQKDTQRISEQAALNKKEEETMTLIAERQQLGGKNSTKRVPVGKLCAKLSRKLFRPFMANSRISSVINYGLSKGKAWFRCYHCYGRRSENSVGSKWRPLSRNE